MNIAVEKIRVARRIRRQATKIEELAADIRKNGLINPITVMVVDGGYQLLAGLRRLRAAQSLGWTEIEATVAAPKDAEAALTIEHSENEQREAFTFSEKMDYARLIEEIERAKAKERMLAGKKEPDPVVGRPQGSRNGRTRDKVGPKIGLSAKQYDRAKYVADHAPQEVIDELDHGKRTVFGTYKELRTEELRAAQSKPQAGAAPVAPAVPEPAHETDLERAIRAERELDALRYRQHNEIYHRDSIIENLRNRVAELEAALDAANARIRELEGEAHARQTL